jgi:tape measure domain-containing protein
VLAYADAFTNIQNQLRIVTNGTEELTTVTASLLQIANDTRAAFDATADLYSKLARSTEELGVSQERLLRITDTINKTFATSGASADAARNAIIQLGQGLSAGALRGDEFNSVAEQAPGILRAVSAETGKSIGQLREFAAQGGITAELLIRSIENYADTVDKEFARTNRTFEQSLQVATNNAIAFIGANEQVQSASRAAGNAVVALSENLNLLNDGLILIVSIIAGRYIGALSASVAASFAQIAANKALAASELNLAKQASQRAIQEQLAAQRSLANATNDTLRAGAINRLAAANGNAIATTNALTAAQARYNAVAGIGAAAVRGLSGAFALLGGPAGVILLAASALAIYNSRAKEAEQTGLKEEIDAQVAKFRELNAEGQRLTFQKLTNEQIALSAKLREATDEAERLRLESEKAASGGSFAAGASQLAAYARQQQVVADLTARLNKLTETQTALFNSGLPTINQTVTATNEQADAVGRLGDNLDALRKVSSGIDSLFSGEFNLFGGGEPETPESTALTDSLGQENDLIRAALQSRIGIYETYGAVLNDINAGEFERQRAQLEFSLADRAAQEELGFQAELARLAERRQRILEDENLSNLQRLEALRLLDEQKELQEQATEQRLTEIRQEGIAARSQLDEAEKRTRLLQLGQLGDSLMALGDGQSKKIFNIGKKLALAQAVIALPTAVMESYKNGGGYPWGLVPAAAMAATGLANINKIRSTQYGGGGGGGATVSAGGGGSGGASPTLPTIPQAPQLVGTVEVRGLSALTDELRNSDAQLPAPYVARILDAIQSANRLRGEDI